jgi:hypothetical protein
MVIELILLTDAVRARDIEASRRLARHLARTARMSGWSRIARQARAVELLAILDAPLHHVGAAADRLLLMAEQHLHALPEAEQGLGLSTSGNTHRRTVQDGR